MCVSFWCVSRRASNQNMLCTAWKIMWNNECSRFARQIIRFKIVVSFNLPCTQKRTRTPHLLRTCLAFCASWLQIHGIINETCFQIDLMLLLYTFKVRGIRLKVNDTKQQLLRKDRSANDKSLTL